MLVLLHILLRHVIYILILLHILLNIITVNKLSCKDKTFVACLGASFQTRDCTNQSPASSWHCSRHCQMTSLTDFMTQLCDVFSSVTVH